MTGRPVKPAKAGIQFWRSSWIPAFAGTTKGAIRNRHPDESQHPLPLRSCEQPAEREWMLPFVSMTELATEAAA